MSFMSMKEIINEKVTKSNATRVNVYTIYTTQICTDKNIEHVPSKPTTTSRREKGDRQIQYNMVAMAFSSMREHEPFISRTFVRLFVLDYKSAR